VAPVRIAAFELTIPQDDESPCAAHTREAARRCATRISNFEKGPQRFLPDMNHAALLVHNQRLLVSWTRAGDTPERIYLSSIGLRDDWSEWRESEPVETLRPALATGSTRRARAPSVEPGSGRRS
jgi:hypothetical protein